MRRLLLGKVEDSAVELLEGRHVPEEIEAEQAVHGALRRKVMAGNGHRFDTLPQADDQRDGDDRKVFQAAGSNDRNLARRLCGIASYGDGSFYRDGCGHRSGVDGQAEGLASCRAFEEGVRYEDLGWNRPERLGHGLKGQGITGRKRIVRIGDQREGFISHHRPIDFIPVFAVGQKVSPFGNGDGEIHLHNLDQQPLSMESLANFVDRLGFHHNPILPQIFSLAFRAFVADFFPFASPATANEPPVILRAGDQRGGPGAPDRAHPGAGGGVLLLRRVR